ncbi:MAG: TetR/AcrR family transcriptional regulator [Oscillospiraceae bacterium]|nr:TetR/AcrR family transcriptional regulator [Oscillospiraceae bacterium]
MEDCKHDKIIAAATREFAKGYKAAHTDDIAREAGVSKGLLFHYFGSKEKLYAATLEHAFTVIFSEFIAQIDFSNGDIIERILQATKLKCELTHKYPSLFELSATAYIEGTHAEKFMPLYTDMTTRLFANIDESLFKEGIDAQKAAKVIHWSLTGYANAQVVPDKKLAQYQSEYEHYMAEMQEYFIMFRKLFYKEGDNHDDSNS